MDSNESISGARPGKDKVLKDIVSETRIYRRIYKDMRGFGRIHKARRPLKGDLMVTLNLKLCNSNCLDRRCTEQRLIRSFKILKT